MLDISPVADEAFAVLNTGRQIAPFSARYPGFDLEAAYRVTAAVRAKREAAGARVLGRKIGFTNRTIWAQYDVYAPMWGYIYDRTVRRLADVTSGFSLAGLAEPLLEPEIMFRFARAPSAGMDERALISCIEWVSHGFEIVQSVFPGWKFSAADTVAAYGLHGALFIGETKAVAGREDYWLEKLSAFEIDLFKNGALVDHGKASNVFDGPLTALRHLVDMLAADPVNPPLGPGEIVTTGTLTKALPIAAGEDWSTRTAGIDLPGIELRLV